MNKLTESRILLVSHRLQMGGAEEFAFNLIKTFRSRGVNIELLVLYSDGVWEERFQEAGFAIHQLNFTSQQNKLCQVEQIKVFLENNSYDLVIGNGSIAELSAALTDFSKKIFRVSILHALQKNSGYATFSSEEYWDQIIGVSDGIVEEAKGILNSEVPICTIENGIFLPQLIESDFRTGKENVFQITYLGRLDLKEKNLFMLLDILGKLLEKEYPVRLNILGDGKDRIILQGEIIQQNLTDFVEIKGQISRGQVAKELAQSHVLLLCSENEGFGLVLAEAQLCGCVPIATNIVGCTDLIIDDETGFLLPYNQDVKFVNAIESLINDRDLWLRMSLKAREKAKTKYSIIKMVNHYENIIKEILDRDSQRVNPKLSYWKKKNLQMKILIEIPRKKQSAFKLWRQKIRMILGYWSS